MKKTNNTKTFIGAMMIGFSLLLTGCPQPASGGGENYDEPLPNIVDNLFGDPDWDVTVQGLSAGIVDKDPVFAKWPQYGDALVDTHGKVIKLAMATTSSVFSDKIAENVRVGSSAMTIHDITVTEDSTLSFDYKCDLQYTYDNGVLHKNYLRVFIDDNSEPVFETYGYGQMWQKESLILSAGIHTVKFWVGTDEELYYYGYSLTNAAYLDNITLAPNKIASVDIYPKGLQETYVNGDTIQFSAKALRSDGSVIPDKDITWTSTGGSIDSNGLFTPGNTKGTFTVTASIDGFTASNQTVKVHGSDYLTDPVTINGHTFTGKITKYDNTAFTDTNNIKFVSPTPRYSHFYADGFFVLKGTATNTNPVLFMRKRGDGYLKTDGSYNPDYPYQAYIVLPSGDFEQRIWLHFGDGEYDIWIEEGDVTFNESYDGYEGAWATWNLPRNAGESTYLYVINQSNFNTSSADSAYLLPSDNCQCDDFLITNAFNAVMAELPSDATLGMKLQALYDWEARRSHYDYVSFTTTSTTKRKRQDALHVLKYGMCVCEGYADLYTALARLLGVKAAYQVSANLNHAWTELYYKGKWKMVDVTWDDVFGNPVAENIEKYPTAENYWYFLVDEKDPDHAKVDSEGKIVTPLSWDNVTDYSRSAN